MSERDYRLPSIPNCQDLFSKPQRILPAQFKKRYSDLLHTYPFTQAMVGQKNPYTGHVIKNENDYRLMLREKVYEEYCIWADAGISTATKRMQDTEKEAAAAISRASLREDRASRSLQEAQRREALADEQLAEARQQSQRADERVRQAEQARSQDLSTRTRLHTRYRLAIVALLVISILVWILTNNSSFQKGLEEGSALAEQSRASLRSEAYEEGYEAGVREGYDKGHLEGYSSGYDAGKTAGYSNGYKKGSTEGYARGYDKGSSDGYSLGYDEGYDQGKSDASESLRSSPGNGGGGTGGGGGGFPSYNSDPIAQTYIGNKNSHVFHRPTCSTLPAQKNQVIFNTREEAIAAGYRPCKNCNP